MDEDVDPEASDGGGPATETDSPNRTHSLAKDLVTPAVEESRKFTCLNLVCGAEMSTWVHKRLTSGRTGLMTGAARLSCAPRCGYRLWEVSRRWLWFSQDFRRLIRKLRHRKVELFRHMTYNKRSIKVGGAMRATTLLIVPCHS
jgi:hypothetical protein